MISYPEVGLPVPRTVTSLAVKLAEKKPKIKRSKKSPDGLYEILAPGSSVVKTDTYTSVIKNPEKETSESAIQIWLNSERKRSAKLNSKCMPIGGQK